MTRKPVTVRHLEPADEAEWRRLWTAYLEFYETGVDEPVYQSTFSRLVSRDEPACHGLLAYAGKKPVGLVHYLYHLHLWRTEPVCYLQDLFVEPGARGSGAGRALIEAVYAAADANGAAGVYWLTQDTNETARRLYDRIGQATPFMKYVRPS